MRSFIWRPNLEDPAETALPIFFLANSASMSQAHRKAILMCAHWDRSKVKLDSCESERSLDLPLLFNASYEEQLCVLGVPTPYLTIHILTWLYKPKPVMLLLRAVSIQ